MNRTRTKPARTARTLACACHAPHARARSCHAHFLRPHFLSLRMHVRTGASLYILRCAYLQRWICASESWPPLHSHSPASHACLVVPSSFVAYVDEHALSLPTKFDGDNIPAPFVAFPRLTDASHRRRYTFLALSRLSLLHFITLLHY